MHLLTSRLKATVLLFFIFILNVFPQGLTEGEHTQEISNAEIWYHVIGSNNGSIPILMLHGGPGGTSYSLYRFDDLSDQRQVILLDQPGTGRSGMLKDTSLMTIDYQVDQLHEFITSIGLEDFYLYGHSWGTMLGLDYYLKYPQGIKALILNSPLVSTEMWMNDAEKLISTLSDETQAVIHKHEKSKTYEDPEYQYAIYEYYKLYISRSNKPFRNKYGSKRAEGNSLMYNYMWGPSEFNATGNLKNYDRLEQLADIQIPTLWITGEFDEARPETVRYYHSLTPGSEYAEIEGAAHGTMHDNPVQNIKVIREFLDRLEE